MHTPLTTIAERVTRLWRSRGHLRRGGQPPDARWERRVETLEANTEHLEAVLEGLQDACYRRSVLEDEHMGELRKRTDPDQIARELSRNAERRGL